MKICLIQNSASVDRIFSERSLAKLRSMGEVVINDGDASVESVKKAIKGADVAITSWGNTTLTKEILDECPDLKLVVHAAGTVKPIVSDELWDRGIRVTGSPKPLGQGVAETALGFAISASKNFYNLNTSIHTGGWGAGGTGTDISAQIQEVTELYEITVGVVSSGWVGRHMIKLLQNFDVDVLLYDPFVTEEKCAEMGCTKVDFETLLQKSDIVSIHAPSIPATNHMFNAETLKLMKKDAVLINTARGSIVDEKALYEHMKAGNLKYACIDVYDPEPPTLDNPLRTLPNVIMTPHLAGLKRNGQRRIGMHAAEEIERFINGEKMECEVTKDMLATMA